MIYLTAEQAIWVYRFLDGGPIGDIGDKLRNSIKRQIEEALEFKEEYGSGK